MTTTLPTSTRYTDPGAGAGQLVVPHPTDLPLGVVRGIHRATGVDLLNDDTPGADQYAALAYFVLHLDDPAVTFDQVLHTLRRRDVYVMAPSILARPEDPTAPAPSPSSPPPGEG